MLKFRRQEAEDVLLPKPMLGPDPTSRLYSELDGLNVNRGKFTVDELWDRYKHIFQNFIVNSPNPVSVAAATEDADAAAAADYDFRDGLRFIPKTYHTKVKELFNWMKPRIDKLHDWRLSETGKLLYKNNEISSTNLLDFLSFSVGRVKTPPSGFDMFNTLLRTLSVPVSYLRRDFDSLLQQKQQQQPEAESRKRTFKTPLIKSAAAAASPSSKRIKLSPPSPRAKRSVTFLKSIPPRAISRMSDKSSLSGARSLPEHISSSNGWEKLAKLL